MGTYLYGVFKSGQRSIAGSTKKVAFAKFLGKYSYNFAYGYAPLVNARATKIDNAWRTGKSDVLPCLVIYGSDAEDGVPVYDQWSTRYTTFEDTNVRMFSEDNEYAPVAVGFVKNVGSRLTLVSEFVKTERDGTRVRSFIIDGRVKYEIVNQAA